ncbi:hypothetical protein AVEN_80027-1 [Araneus ventricosus]|uniref:Uncharacterized protein n=1 Tax=Araneus ventricosus TaxID=182803 RepID=A0A4Y2FPN0_ARAVE|nr:hypothetical protein AVEN_80027-1 [Araneus ventricosus]
MLTMLLGQQAVYTKYPCFLCLWDSRARDIHWTKTDWSLQGALTSGENVINTALIPPEKVLLLLLHIKLGLMKQFIKSLFKDGECFRYQCSKFPKLSEAKMKEGVFTGPDTRKLLSDSLFSETKDGDHEKEAWYSFKDVVHRFLENTKDAFYKIIVHRMLTAYEFQRCMMSLKVHFLYSHIDCFPGNLGAYNKEHGERFHQDVRDIVSRYQGRWDVNMLADYCWMLRRETEDGNRKCVRRSVNQKRKKFHRQKGVNV